MGRRRGWRGLAIVVLLLCLSCAGTNGRGAQVGGTGPALRFTFFTAAGERVTSDQLRGRTTVLLFVTTYDAASQLEVRELQSIVERHNPRFNAVVVVLEAPQYALLATVYAESLELTIPVVLSDYAARTGEGPFGDLNRVPTVVILDSDARVVWRKAGAVPGGDLEKQIRRATGPARGSD